MEHRGLSLD